MKRQMVFKTVSEMNQYFPDGVPSKVLAIVEEQYLPDGSYIYNQPFTTTNNITSGSVTSAGTSAMTVSYNISYSYTSVEKDYTELELSYQTATEKSEDVLVGQHNSTVEVQN